MIICLSCKETHQSTPLQAIQPSSGTAHSMPNKIGVEIIIRKSMEILSKQIEITSERLEKYQAKSIHEVQESQHLCTYIKECAVTIQCLGQALEVNEKLKL